MKKSGILNSEISRALSYMGHTDEICIGDLGLPIPPNVERIDISLKIGTPSFIETLEEVSKDMWVEKIILAEEIKEQNKEVLLKIKEIYPNTEMAFVPHEQFKEQTKNSKAIIRTGEATPYANIILKSAVAF